MTIKAIIFDLGGVLLRTADFAPREQLAAILGMSRHELEEFIFGRESGDQAQRGEIAVRQHWENLCRELKYSPEEFQHLLDEFFSYDQLDPNLLDYVRELHKTHKTALLSNAWDDLRQVIAEKWHFEDAFDELIISAEVKLAKPDRRIFELALDRLKVQPSEAIFVDDMQRNIDGASKAGLIGILFRTPEQAKQDIEFHINNHRG
jgi:epoxide hydrolase-like predicted phosphatase